MEERLAFAKNCFEKSIQKRNLKHNQKVKIRSFEVGDWVLVRNHVSSSALKDEIKKFALLYLGPYRVKAIKLENAYALENENGEFVGTFNISQLRPFKKTL